MIPIDFFTQLSKACSKRPFLLLEKVDQKVYLEKIKKIVTTLKNNLEKKQLQKSHAYKLVKSMENSVTIESLDEFHFAKALAQLDTLYGQKTDPQFYKKVKTMDSFAEKFYKRAQEFYILEKRIDDEKSKLNDDEINKHDLKMLHEIGFFYVLEFTLLLEQELKKANKDKQRVIIEQGISVEQGNLPGLKPLMASFCRELAFNIYQDQVRWDVLKAFYDYNSLLENDDIEQQIKGLSHFHIAILNTMIKAGLESFTGLIYKPYPDNTLLKDIIIDLKK